MRCETQLPLRSQVSRPLMSTLYISHPASLNHLTPPGHPERPDRIRAIETALEKERFAALIREQAPMAEMESLLLAHPESYVVALREACPRRAGSASTRTR